jgi:hypothetical protein
MSNSKKWSTTIKGYINPLPDTFNEWTTDQQDRWNYFHYRNFTKQNWLEEEQIKKVASNAGLVGYIDVYYIDKANNSSIEEHRVLIFRDKV